MNNNNQDALDWSTFALGGSRIDLFKNGIASSVQYDFYHGRTNFKAVALSPSIPLSQLQAAALPGGNSASTSDRVAKYIIKARIIEANSPHSWLPDPCRMDKSADPITTMNIIAAHTTFVAYGDPTAKFQVPVKPGDIISVQMTPRNGSYDLQFGKFLDVLERSNLATYMAYNAKECVPLATLFPKFPEFGNLDPEPMTAEYFGVQGQGISIENGRIESRLLGTPNQTYSTAGRLLIDLIPSFDSLAKGFYEKFGRKLGVNSTYRTYEQGVDLWDGGNNKLAAPPGTSKHGWGAAFDWSISVGWGDQSVADRTKQFETPDWKWMHENATKYSVDGVYWHNPSWARPTNLGGTGAMLEAWHWEASNFADLIRNRRKPSK